MLQAIGFNLNTAEDVMAMEDRYWRQRVYELVEYRAVHGDCNVPKDGSVLSKWVGSVRAQYKRNEIPPDRIQLLESLGFEWKRSRNQHATTVMKPAQQQHQQLALANPFGNELLLDGTVVETTTFAPVVNTPHDSMNLQAHNNNNHQAPQNQLATITTPTASPKQPKGVRAMAYAADLDAKWNKKFEELIKYKEIHGHVNVPQDNKELGRWVSTQREKKRQTDLVNAGYVFPPDKKRRPCMLPDQIAKLESIGFKWKVNTIVGWDARYEQLLEYKRKHGDVHVPQSYAEDVAFVSTCAYDRKHTTKERERSVSQGENTTNVDFFSLGLLVLIFFLCFVF